MALVVLDIYDKALTYKSKEGGKSQRTDSRRVAAGGWVRTENVYEHISQSLQGQWKWLKLKMGKGPNSANTFKTIELCTLKGMFYTYVNAAHFKLILKIKCCKAYPVSNNFNLYNM